MAGASFCLDGWCRRKAGLPALTPAALEAWQRAAAWETVAYAAQNAPFYRALYGGVPRPGPWEAFRRLPTVCAQDIVAQGGRMLARGQEEAARVFTSGTTAAPKRLFFTEAELLSTVDYFHQGSRQFIRKGQRALLLYPCESPSGAARLFGAALGRIGAEAVYAGVPASPALAAACVQKHRPHLVLCEPRLALALASFPLRFETLLLSGEALAEADRARLAAAFGCAVFMQYGLTESCFGLGVECGLHEGYHLRAADYYVEILDENGGAPPPGVYGRVAITSLGRGAMPLIRYDTGDVARLLPPCPCGSPLPRLSPVLPRSGPKGYYGGGLTL